MLLLGNILKVENRGEDWNNFVYFLGNVIFFLNT